MTATGGKGRGSVVNMLKRTGKKRERRTYNAQIQATVTEAEPDVNVVTAATVSVPQVAENLTIQPDAPVRVIEGGENSSTKKRKVDKQIIIEDDTGGVGETDDNPIYCPPWTLRSKDEVTTAKQAEEFLYNGLLPKDKGKMKVLTDAAVANGFLTQKYQNIMFDVEMLQQMGQLMRVNRALRTSNEKAEGKIKDVQASVTKVNEEMEKMKKNEADTEEQLKTWKKKI